MRPAVVGLSTMLLVAVVAFGGQAPEVISGTASFVQDGANWTITTSDQAVIHWGSFSVPAGSTTRFVQPGASSVVINRVVGSSASFINGVLTANGRLALINPNGIRIGSTGVVRAQGFLASTLANVSNEQIFVGRGLHFKGASAASIENYGRIEALGGDVHLIARRVVNAGTVSAPRGRVGMAAGNEVLLTQDGKLFVKVSDDDVATGGTGVDAGGVVEAVQVELAAHGNMYALAINTRGIVRATGISRSADGRITLRGAGGTVRTNGRLAAKTVDEQGVSRGGTVQIVARDIEIGGSTVIDVSGAAGGGTVHIGGGSRGAGPLPNARNTWVRAGAQIIADATGSGDGGEVVVWADGIAEFFGRITARGGPSGGDGGFVEVSGKDRLIFRGTVDTAAPDGAAGTLLLDPTDVVLRPGSGGKGEDTLWGGRGDDKLAGGGGDDKIWGGRGDDKPDDERGNDRLWGGRGDDVLSGGRGDNKLWGGRGGDALCGGGGDDKIWGGRGDDKPDGEGGADVLCGGRGDDVLSGGGGDDKIWGGRGNDALCGGDAPDKIINNLSDFCGPCRPECAPNASPRPPPPGRPPQTRRPPVWWDITNRTEEWITASDDGHITPALAEVLREYEPVRFWAEPLADVMDMMNAHFDGVVLAREHMNFYAWR